MAQFTMTPAYGRDYKSRATLLADFQAGKDFICQPSGQYISIRDLRSGDSVQFRYRKMRETFIYHHK